MLSFSQFLDSSELFIVVIETTKTCVGPYINENFTNLNIYHILLKTKMLKKKTTSKENFQVNKKPFFPKNVFKDLYIYTI